MGTMNPPTYERRLRARFVRRAIKTDAPLLASLLHHYALAESLTWEQLAQSLECTVDALNQIAICRPPRPEHFVADVEAIAADYVDPDRLLPLLRRLQVLAAFADRAAQTQAADAESALLLAARDHEADHAAPTETGTPPAGTENDHV